jgi:hypothetical protein
VIYEIVLKKNLSKISHILKYIFDVLFTIRMRQNGSVDNDNTDDMAYVSAMDTPSDVYVDCHFISIKIVLKYKFLKLVFYLLLPIPSVYFSTSNLYK